MLDPIIATATFILPFLFVLTVVVFFHELGHFLVARWAGVEVETFSVGFGPEIVGFNDRRGTRWRLSAIPLGGYVKFLGDANAASVPDGEAVAQLTDEERRRSFPAKSVGARAAIVAAGPIANFLLAIVIFTAVLATFGDDVLSPRVDEVVPDSAAAEAGLEVGDLILAIDGKAISAFEDLQTRVMTGSGEELELTVLRDDAEVDVTLAPRREEVTDGLGNTVTVWRLGIARQPNAEDVIHRDYTVPQAALTAVQRTWNVVGQSLSMFGKIITGRESAEQLGGPILIAQVSSQVASIGFVSLLEFAAFISVSIGLINLFPIPLLDGGHLVFYAAEAIRGKPLSERVQEIGYRVGFAAIAMLMIFAVWNDSSRILSRWL